MTRTYLKANDGDIVLLDETRSDVGFLVGLLVYAANDGAKTHFLDAAVDVHNRREAGTDDRLVVNNHHLHVEHVGHLHEKSMKK